MMSKFGNFNDFCRDSTIPVCNLFYDNAWGHKSCPLQGISTGDAQVRNLGTIICCVLALITTVVLYWLSDRKKAAVGRREIQVLLISYAIVSFAEIFSVGGFLTDKKALWVFTAIHIGAITATFWLLLVNAVVGYQLMDDGTIQSVSLAAGSALVVFVVVGYVALDTSFNFTGRLVVTNTVLLKSYPLYVLYLLIPLMLLVAYFILETVVVLGVLREKRPMILLILATILFVISQIFNFVISVHICNSTGGKIDGSMFETLFVLFSVIAMWCFWDSITEDDFPEEDIMEPTYA